ncbi:hypothetical protein Zmor_027063 [Zophobas morio]|uniref:Protein kinase domain-containing protein n=1 Tax=Zophobas morio TaxID=2755281 RepID=A0AA38HL24_9CUCU|nr:hypothetical protein Zmor_027063 [Zophobas morio]
MGLFAEGGIYIMYSNTVLGVSFLKKANPDLPENKIRFYAAEILLPLYYLHDKINIAFLDLTPEHILLDQEGHVCLCDFGQAKRLRKGTCL